MKFTTSVAFDNYESRVVIEALNPVRLITNYVKDELICGIERDKLFSTLNHYSQARNPMTLTLLQNLATILEVLKTTLKQDFQNVMDEAKRNAEILQKEREKGGVATAQVPLVMDPVGLAEMIRDTRERQVQKVEEAQVIVKKALRKMNALALICAEYNTADIEDISDEE